MSVSQLGGRTTSKAVDFQEIIRERIYFVKPEPDRGFPQAQSAHDNLWDFISLTPEAMHMVMWVMSDRAILRSFLFTEGFGVHTFRFPHAKGESIFVTFHWKPNLGLQSVVWNEATKINGADPDLHRRDLCNAIQSGNFPEWELCVQLFDQDCADRFDFDVLDATKLIPEELIKPVPIGRLVLDRIPDNFFAEPEHVAFMTQNVPRGIDFPMIPATGQQFFLSRRAVEAVERPELHPYPDQCPEMPFSSRTGIWRCTIRSGA